MASIIEAVKAFQSTAIIGTARFATSRTVEAVWNYKHIPSNASNAIETKHDLADDGSASAPVWGSPTPVAPTSLNVLCRRRGYRAIVRSWGERDPKNQHLEIWAPGKPVKIISLPKTLCGDVIKPGTTFGCAAFSHDGDRFAFVANRAEDKSQSFFEEETETKPKEVDAAAKQKPKGYEYDYKVDWGEQLPIRNTVIIVVEIASGIVGPIEAFSEDFSWGQFDWHPKETNVLVCCGFPNEDKRQGLIFFNTRRSVLRAARLSPAVAESTPDAELDKPAPKISSELLDRNFGDNHSPASPKFNPSGTRLAFTTTDDVLYHQSCSRLIVHDWAAGTNSTAVDVVGSPTGLNDFPGLWLRSVAERPWLDDDRIVFSTQNRARMALVAIDIAKNRVINLDAPAENVSVDLLDVLDGKVLCKVDNPLTPPKVIVATLTTKSDGAVDIKWAPASGAIESPAPLAERFARPLDGAKVHVISVSGPLFETIVLLPAKVNADTRLVLFPHGGPHAASTLNFSAMYPLLVGQNFAITMPNFRGSTGYGQQFLESLPGHCGDWDVQDCIKAMETTLEAVPELEKENVVVMGGSHGGFLTLWLIAKFPEKFKAAVARNPVANIAHMISTTDIPDWCAFECGLAWDKTKVATAADYERMYAASPVSQIDKVKTPTLLMLGDLDRRVPMSQGLDYYRVLKAR
ncbi:hypothetical protein HK101_001350, partial [Irineochytrium annulatum]